MMQGGNHEVVVTLKIRTYSTSSQDAINLVETQIYSAFNDVDDISSYTVIFIDGKESETK